MTHGTGSTLVLHPVGRSDLTFNLSGALTGVTTYTYIADLGRLDLNEEARWKWAYEQSPAGGRVVGNTAELVPVRLALIIKAASSDYRKEAYRVLQHAVMNRRGGTLEYLPEGAGSGTLSTFYHYVASGPPRVLDDARNRWDADPIDGWYTLQVELDLQTQPLATSDPDNPVTISYSYDTAVLDAANDNASATGTSAAVDYITQEFVPTQSGLLTQISYWRWENYAGTPGTLLLLNAQLVEIGRGAMPQTSGGSGATYQEVPLTLDVPALVTAGQTYIIAIPPLTNLLLERTTGNLYPAGRFGYLKDGQYGYYDATQDLRFTTYVRPFLAYTVLLDNWYSATQTNRLLVKAEWLAGSFPALARFFITPSSGQRLGRVTLFTRNTDDGALGNLLTVYEAEDAETIVPAVSWDEVADTARGGGSYMRCLPNADANGVAQGLRFTLAHPTDAHGRFAVFGVGYDDAVTAGVWTHQVKLVSGNVAQAGESDYYATSTQGWQLIFVGEFELPLTNLADVTAGYAAGPYLEWYSTRASGDSEFRLDGLLLVWVSDALGPEGAGTALDVPCADGDVGYIQGGVVATDRLLIENLLGVGGQVVERAYVVDSASNLKRALAAAPKGDFVALRPGYDQEIIIVQERATGVEFTDDFESYKAACWLSIGRMEADEAWQLIAAEFSAAHFIEGATALDVYGSALIPLSVYAVRTEWLDLETDGRFTDADYVVLRVYVDNPTDIATLDLIFLCPDWDNYYYLQIQSTDLVAGWNYFTKKKSDFLSDGSPDWADSLLLIRIQPGEDYLTHIWLDYWTIEKADPDNANVSNVTGDVWNFQPAAGVWTITEDVEEDDPGATLAYLYTTAHLGVAYLDMDTPDDVRLTARVQTKNEAGYAGLFWRGDETLMLTTGYEQCYASLLYTSGAGSLGLYRYASGVPTTLYSTANTYFPDKWYTLGVESKGSTQRLYCALSSALSYDDSAVFSATHLKTTVTDATYSSGKIGFLANGALGRFDDVVVESLGDKHVPADQITVSGQALFRTIAPFD